MTLLRSVDSPAGNNEQSLFFQPLRYGMQRLQLPYFILQLWNDRAKG
jgi:hypothetical protein